MFFIIILPKKKQNYIHIFQKNSYIQVEENENNARINEKKKTKEAKKIHTSIRRAKVCLYQEKMT